MNAKELETIRRTYEFQFVNGKITLVNPAEETGWFLERGYGEKSVDGKLVLSPVEALYLVETGKIKIRKENSREEYSFNELVELFSGQSETFWRDYVIYRDLRRRRYVVKEGFSNELRFRLFERGEYGEKPAKYIIIPIHEGKDIQVSNLIKIIGSCKAMNKEPIIAVVDRRNEIVYYSASQVELRNL